MLDCGSLHTVSICHHTLESGEHDFMNDNLMRGGFRLILDISSPIYFISFGIRSRLDCVINQRVTQLFERPSKFDQRYYISLLSRRHGNRPSSV